MSPPNPPNNPWQQMAQEMASCSFNVMRTVLPDATSLRLLYTSVLRAQAEVLKGLLAVVEAKLGSVESPPPTGEKIPVD